MITVDQARCSGCGLCIELCPEVFTWGPDGKAQTAANSCETHNLEDVSDQCPMECIDI